MIMFVGKKKKKELLGNVDYCNKKTLQERTNGTNKISKKGKRVFNDDKMVSFPIYPFLFFDPFLLLY